MKLLSFVVVTGVMGEPCVGEFAIKEESNSSESPSGSRDLLKFSSNKGVWKVDMKGPSDWKAALRTYKQTVKYKIR